MSAKIFYYDHRSRANKQRALSAGIFYLAVVIFWEVASRTGLIQSPFFPPPSKIFFTFLSYLSSVQWRVYFWSTFSRFIAAFIPGAILGVCCGWLFGLNRSLKLLVGPVIATLYFIPKLWLLLPLLFLFDKAWLLNILPPLLLVFVTMAGSALLSTEGIEQTYFDISRNYGAGRSIIFKDVVLPATLPQIYMHLQIAVLLSLRIIIVFEVFTQASEGLGAFVWQGWKYSKYEDIWVGLLSVFVMALVISVPAKLFKKILIPWR
ncbi:MAG TPA: hypothetical protein DCL35_01140 [Candidatus Omnitrophica bacterium]|nr:hypothetical protein [Candidatus Omnitrophota bacterium]